MRKALALLGALVAVLSIAVTGASGIDRPQTFSLLEVSGKETPIGGGEQGPPKAGDGFASTSVLYKWAGRKRGARIGRDEVTCTFLRVSASEQQFSLDAHCTADIFLLESDAGRPRSGAARTLLPELCGPPFLA